MPCKMNACRQGRIECPHPVHCGLLPHPDVDCSKRPWWHGRLDQLERNRWLILLVAMFWWLPILLAFALTPGLSA